MCEMGWVWLVEHGQLGWVSLVGCIDMDGLSLVK